MGDKLDTGTASAKIKVLISRYYEMLGRKDRWDSYELEKELIEDIDEVLSNTDIDMKKVIVERLEQDRCSDEEREYKNEID